MRILKLAVGVVVVGVLVAKFAQGQVGVADRPVEIPPAAPGQAQNAPHKIKENVVAYETGDAAMNAAKQKARATLPRFRELVAKKTPGTYTIKFPLTQNGATEHIWLQLTGDRGTDFVGQLANDPVNGRKYKRGDRMTVAAANVEDWMVSNGKEIYGGYTARVALDQLPKAKQEQLRGMFRD